MTKAYQWQLFFWAALHSADFWQCYIIFPVGVDIRKSWRCNARIWALEIRFQRLGVYVPYSIELEHYYAQHGEFPYDDLPF